MDFIKTSIEQPITVAVGVILSVIAGLIALAAVPVQLAPEVEDTVVAVTTTWENASPEEVERDVVDRQEEALQGLPDLVSMTSVSRQGQGQIRLQFKTGTDKDDALQEVLLKLQEVPSYPEGVDEPAIEDTDPENRDYIAWVVLVTDDPALNPQTLRDFAEDRVKPRLERVAGISEVGLVGGRELELQIRVDAAALAQRGIPIGRFVEVIRGINRNFSGGDLADGKFDVRVRSEGRFSDPSQVLEIVIDQTDDGPVYVRDVAEVIEAYKEREDFVYSRGLECVALNFQKELGANVISIIDDLEAELATMNAEGGMLAGESTRLELAGDLELRKVYDQTGYIRDAIALVRGNILVGGTLAVIVLLLFLRSVRAVGIIALAIPISIVGSIVVLVALGRSVNVISLAGMAFATGMVVDNAIVVLENIYRHLQMGKRRAVAAYDGTREVGGAVLASTLTTLVVFIPILLIEEASGQLFRDIALAICAAVGISLVTSLTVIPSASALILPHRRDPNQKRWCDRCPETDPKRSRFVLMVKAFERARRAVCDVERISGGVPRRVGAAIYWLTGGWVRRLATAGVFIVGCLVGTWLLLPPIDYLPAGNRNIAFGLMFPPPGYSQQQLDTMADRVMGTMRPYWLAAGRKFDAEALIGVPDDPPDTREPITVPPPPDDPDAEPVEVMPPPLSQYFLVSREGQLFHGGIVGGEEGHRAKDTVALMNQAAALDVNPGTFSFAFQLPLFRVGGNTGAAVKVDLSGNDLGEVTAAAGALRGTLFGEFGPQAVQGDPANFDTPTPQIRLDPDYFRITDSRLDPADLAAAVPAVGDGLLLPDSYEALGQLKDTKIIFADAVDQTELGPIEQTPIATRGGDVVPLGSVVNVSRGPAAEAIKRVGRVRAVTLQVTPPRGVPLGAAVEQINDSIAELRGSGAIPPTVTVDLAGSAGKLAEVREALIGDGSLVGTLTSSLMLAVIVVYLLMCVLFQSWLQPLVIMVSVPLATFGGFLALKGVHLWSVADRYMPVQNLDVLTILGFVILAGVVVNNAILIVHQTNNFLSGKSRLDEEADGAAGADGAADGAADGVIGKCSTGQCTPREAIRAAVESRVRPILMSTLTSVGGMLPLVLIPGSGSELYRGLGAVVVGGLLVSTVFTLVLVPVLLSALLAFRRERAPEPAFPAQVVPAE